MNDEWNNADFVSCETRYRESMEAEEYEYNNRMEQEHLQQAREQHELNTQCEREYQEYLQEQYEYHVNKMQENK